MSTTMEEYRNICKSIVGSEQKTVNGDSVLVLKHWVSARGKDFFWIELKSKRRIDVEAWHITDALDPATTQNHPL